jgi:dihydrolipoamide dehydrogenase
MSSDSDGERFDAIIIGSGPAGGVVASRLAEQDMRPALVEQELVGGECAYWACIPSKTLLRPGEVQGEAERAPGSSSPELRWSEIAEYRDYMVRSLDDKEEIESYEKEGVSVVKGRGVVQGPGEVEVGGRVLRSDRIVIATGSEPQIPPIDGLEQVGYWTNREATTFSDPPESAVILGGGPVGVELAQLMCSFGVHVHLVEAADRLLSREDPRVGELLLDSLRCGGIEVHVGVQASSVEERDGDRIVQVGDDAIAAEKLIVAVGRRPRVEGIGLHKLGVKASADSGIDVDERCRAGEGVWAVGDVTGQLPFTHVGMYQGRVVAADIAGESVRADYRAIPRVVFSDPEVAAVGLTEAQARESGIDVSSVSLELGKAIARPYTYEKEPRGELALVVDKREKVLVGAWAVGPLASEWIHYAALALKARIPIEVLKDTVAQFPTYTEAYLKALEKLEL